MAESKHTPGPWEADDDMVIAPGQPKRRFGSDRQFSGPFIVTQCGLYTSPDRETVLANARLIAAAPELLKACKSAWEWLMDIAQHNEAAHAAFVATRDNRDINVIRAAIAKAEGETV